MKLIFLSGMVSLASAGAGVVMLVGKNFDRVLLHRDTRGYWDFPFGGEESYDKSHKDSAIREAYEELGVPKRTLLAKLDPLHKRASKGGLYVACYRGDLVRDLGMRSDKKITTSKNNETKGYDTPLIRDVLSGKFERDTKHIQRRGIRSFNKKAFEYLSNKGQLKCFEE